MNRKLEQHTLVLKAKIILGRIRTKHLKPIVMYFRTKSVIPAIQSKSKKSMLSTLVFRNIKLKRKTEHKDTCKIFELCSKIPLYPIVQII